MTTFLLHPSLRPRHWLAAALLGLCLSAVASPKTTKATLNPVAVVPVAAPASVQRLLIRYRTGIKMGAAAAASHTERAQAAAQVDRSASLAGEGKMRYLKSVSPNLHVVTLDTPVSAAEAQAMMQRLSADPAVLDVMIDQRAKPHLMPNDPNYTDGQQWHLRSPSEVAGGLNLNAAWDRSTGAGVVIAILDGGYTEHPDLTANLLAGYDFVSADNNPALYGGNQFWTANDRDARDSDARDPGDWVTLADQKAGYCDEVNDSTWHGTHVAGLAAASGNNGSGGVGVAFGAKILPVRVLGRCGGYVSDILAGGRWAAGLSVPEVPDNTTPAKILSMSLGLPGECSAMIQSEIDAIRAQRVSIVASTGNDASTLLSAPANCRGVMAVTAHTREGDSANYANVGARVAVSAPGGGLNTLLSEQPGTVREIASTGNEGSTEPAAPSLMLLKGTSMAVPQVAGLLALLAQLPTGLAMSTLEALIADAARPFPLGSYCVVNPNQLPANFCGRGMVDALAAVNLALAAPPVSGDLSVEQRVPLAEVVPGQRLSFQVILRNAGPEVSNNVSLSQQLGPGLELRSVTASLPISLARSTRGVTASLPSLAVNGSVTLSVEAVVLGASANATAIASVSSSTADPAASNNQDSVVLGVRALPVGSAGESASGGGCTVAPNGQVDHSLLLLTLGALALVGWRRRRPAR